MATLQSFLLCFAAAAAVILIPIHAELTPNFYDGTCPQALPTIRNVVMDAIRKELPMGASLLRLHFHDCFVNGCDGSNLLDDTDNFTGEKTAFPNLKSLIRAFEVIDQIKSAVDKVCNGSVVSCADISAVAARDSISILGGPFYDVLLGRRDAKSTSWNHTNTSLPSPTSNLSQFMICKFQSHGLNLTAQLLTHYNNNPDAFAADVSASMIKVGNTKPLTGRNGEIRSNCRKIN